MTRAADYLRIPEAYCSYLGGLRWCPSGEAVEYAEEDPVIGCTFALDREIALFLEGFAGVTRPIGFGFVLHLLYLLGQGIKVAPGEGREWTRARRARDLTLAFREAGRPLRNAGALCAELCRGIIPRAADPPEMAEVILLLARRPTAVMPLGPDARTAPAAELPPLIPAEFEDRVLGALAALSPEDLRHWLRHGQGPRPGAAEAVAREALAVRPRSLAGTLDALLHRRRLAGAAPLVAHLAGALTLPPRRLAAAELPTGGYADVTTRGLPEQILPGQFALDDLEFLRRFAAHELLYFHREEPRAPATEELVLVVDQGVRTWGDVRLVLGAAALVLGRQAARRELPLRLVVTGAPGRVVDPLELGDEALGRLLEASDLSPHPAEALAAALAEPAERIRDVVLLTHPRSLAEPEVAEAARGGRPGTRLFAVAVDGTGEVQLAEMRQGAAVALGRCRVAIAAPMPGPMPPAGAAAATPPAWIGDVEPVGFPFCLGRFARFNDPLFDFDAAGDWLLAAGPLGLLYAWRSDGSREEMLPRGMARGKVLDVVEAVLGVAGGFVVAGRTGEDLVAVHYDFPGRACTAHVLGPARKTVREWSYFRDLHAVTVRSLLASRGVLSTGATQVCAVDLGAGVAEAYYPARTPAGSCSPRAEQAFSKASSRSSDEPSPRHLPILSDGQPFPEQGHALRLVAATGTIDARTECGVWTPFAPLADGQPALKGARVLQARSAGGTLAVLVEHPGKTRSLRLYSFPQGRPIGEYPLGAGAEWFTLARDGRSLARIGDRGVEIRRVDSGRCSLAVIRQEGPGARPDVVLRADFLAVRAGEHIHLIRWQGGHLTLSHGRGHEGRWHITELAGVVPEVAWATDTAKGREYTSRRFAASCTFGGLTARVDGLGQVALFDAAGAAVAMFCVVADQVAAWLPDGTRLGPLSLIGGPPTPGAARRIGGALHEASRPGRVVA